MPFMNTTKPNKNYQFVPLFNALIDGCEARDIRNLPQKKNSGNEILQSELDYIRQLLLEYDPELKPNDDKGFLVMPGIYTSTGGGIYSYDSLGDDVPVLKEHFDDLAQAIGDALMPVFQIALRLDKTTLSASAELLVDGDIIDDNHSREFHGKTETDNWTIDYQLEDPEPEPPTEQMRTEESQEPRSRIYYRCYGLEDEPPEEWEPSGDEGSGSITINILHQGTAIKINAPEAEGWGGRCDLQVWLPGPPVEMPSQDEEVPDESNNGVAKTGCGHCCDLVANPLKFLVELLVKFSGKATYPLALAFPECFGLQIAHFIAKYAVAGVSYGQYNCDTGVEEQFQGSGSDEFEETASWKFYYIRRPSGALVRFNMKDNTGTPINTDFKYRLYPYMMGMYRLQFDDDIAHVFNASGTLIQCDYRKDSDYFTMAPPGNGVTRTGVGGFYQFVSPVTGGTNLSINMVGIPVSIFYNVQIGARSAATVTTYDRIGEVRYSSDPADAAGFEFSDFYPTGETPDFGEMTDCFVTDFISTTEQPMGKFVEKQYGPERRVRGYWNKVGSALTPAELTDFSRTATDTHTFVESVNTIKYGAAGRSSAIRYELKRAFPFGEMTVTEYRKYGTEDQLEANYRYGEDPAEGSYGKLIYSSDFNGVWRRLEYDALGRLSKEITAYGDTADDAPESACRVVLYDYTPLSAGEAELPGDTRPRTVITRTLDVETARSYYRYWENESWQIAAAAPGAAYDTAGNRITKQFSYAQGDWQGWPYRSEYPDGTTSETTYAKENITLDENDNELYELCTTVSSGHLPGHGTREFTRKDYAGNVIESERYDIASNLLISGTTYTYDQFNRVLTEETVDGDLTATEYNCCGPRFVTDPSGMITEYAYDVFNRLTFSRAAEVTTYHEYDADNNETATILAGRDSGELTTSREYDGDGELISTTDAAGAVTEYQRGAGWEETTDALGGTERREYRTDGNLKLISGTAAVAKVFNCGVENGECYTEEWTSATEWVRSYTDFLGRSYKRRYSDDFVETTDYDALGRVSATADSCGARTLFIYDQTTGKLKYQVRKRGTDNSQIEWTLDQVTEFEDDYVLDATAVMHRNRTYLYFGGVRTEVAREETRRDNKLRVSVQYDRTTTNLTAYGNDGETTETTTNYDGTTVVNSLTDGILQQTEHSVLGETGYVYDEFNRQTGSDHEEDGVMVSVRSTLDAMGRVLTTTRATEEDADGLTVTFTYDTLGRKLTETSPGEITTTYTYSPRGEILSIAGGVYRQEYAYDEQGRLTSLTTYRDETHPEVTAYSYDQRGRMTVKTYADLTEESSLYRGDGRIEERINVREQTTASDYNRAGELTELICSAGLDREFAYDLNGRLVGVTDSAANYTLTPDEAGNVTAEVGPYATVTRTFDALQRRSTLSLGSTLLASYAYGATDGRLATLSNGAATLEYSYVPGTNRLAKREWLAGTPPSPRLTQEYGYDTYGRLTGITVNGTPEIAYTLDADSRRTAAALGDETTWSYGYDGKGQLLSAEREDENETPLNTMSYAYDEIGNRLTASEDLASKAYIANDLNQYTAINAETPTYDADGNMLTNDGWSYTWNCESRLVAAEKAAIRLEFAYDYMGRRVYKKVYDSNTLVKHEKYVYDGFKLIAVIDGLNNDAVIMTFVWQPIDLDVPVCMTASGNTYYYITDGNKNVTGLVDSTGARVATYLYGPFGQTLSATGTAAALNPFRFSSEFHDDETGLVYYNYRYYSPALGRWTKRDPWGIIGNINLYINDNNNVNYYDLLGLLLFAFDGTANIPSDRTNVYLMAENYLRGAKEYYPGIGNELETDGLDKNIQQGTGYGMESIVRQAINYLEIESASEKGKLCIIDVIGFSRGAVTAVRFAQRIANSGKFQDIKIRFMGLFDPVPGPFITPDATIPNIVQKTAIAYSQDEQRTTFTPTMYIGRNITRRLFRGGHSDIGGGYKDRGLANMTLAWMIREANMANSVEKKPLFSSSWGSYASYLDSTFTSRLILHQEHGISGPGLEPRHFPGGIQTLPNGMTLVDNNFYLEYNGKIYDSWTF